LRIKHFTLKSYISYILNGILAFHIFITLWSFYSLFTDYTGWTNYHLVPFGYLIYTVLWVGVCKKSRLISLAYLLVSLLEVGAKLFLNKSALGQAIGDVMFPANLIFIAIIALLYNLIFKSPVYESE
jgi:hypothetical protein